MSIEAGDFDRRFSLLLAERLPSVSGFSRELVEECYAETRRFLRTAPMKSDALYIEQMYADLEPHFNELRSLPNQEAASRIFSIIFTK